MYRTRIIAFCLRLLSFLPLPVAHAMGAGVGRLWRVFPTDLRRISRINIDQCFPTKSNAQRAKLLRQSLMETGKTMAEIGFFWHRPLPQVLAQIRHVSGVELLQQAIAAGNGVILATPHIGAWEIVGFYCAQHSPITCLYRPPRMAALDGILRNGRERAGVTLAPTNASGVGRLYKTLKRGGVIGILPDQDPGRGSAGAFAPFFGISANTMTLVARLLHKTDACVLLTYAERLPHGRGYHIHIVPAPAGLDDADANIAASRLNQAVEDCVNALPTQYQWSYKRFKTRPENGAKLY